MFNDSGETKFCQYIIIIAISNFTSLFNKSQSSTLEKLIYYNYYYKRIIIIMSCVYCGG